MTRPKFTASLLPLATLLAGLAATPAATPERIHEKFEIGPGISTLLVYNTSGSTMDDVDLGFGGNANALRIRRVRANCAGPDVTFADATPHDASDYFAGAPFGTAANYFEITVENVGDKAASLQFRMSFVRGSSPPCGL